MNEKSIYCGKPCNQRAGTCLSCMKEAREEFREICEMEDADGSDADSDWE